MKILMQTQLSNYDSQGTFILEADSGWQMMMGRARVMLGLDPDLRIDIMGPPFPRPQAGCVMTSPYSINPDLWQKYAPSDRLNYIVHSVLPNALATRYDFNFEGLAAALDLNQHRRHPELRYDLVYVNDPMHLRNLRALFHLKGGYTPRFVVHSHFVDNPSCPKFPTEASLWLGQCEAAIRADWNFWQCGSAMDIFFEEMGKVYRPEVTEAVRGRSEPWDDGYSREEITAPYDAHKLRFDPAVLAELAQEKTIIFVPNRIGGKGRSSDYTQCGTFMFEVLPELARLRAERTGSRDYVVIAGNPSQKILNSELQEWCGPVGYLSLVPNALNRDEFKCVARMAHIAVGLYNADSYGGTAARECIELGCLPFWADCYEYSRLAADAGWNGLTRPDLSTAARDLSDLIDRFRDPKQGDSLGESHERLRQVIRQTCSYEETTHAAYERMKQLFR